MNNKGMHVDFTGDSSGFDKAVKDAQASALRFAASLTAVDGAMTNFFNLSGKGKAKMKNIIPEKVRKDLDQTLSLYSKLTTAVKGFAAASTALGKMNPSSVKQFASALNAMQSALGKVKGTTKENYEAINRTLSLYKQVASITATVTAEKRREAAEREKNAAAARKEAAAAEKARAAAIARNPDRPVTSPLPTHGPMTRLDNLRSISGDRASAVNTGMIHGPKYDAAAAEAYRRATVGATTAQEKQNVASARGYEIHQRTRYALYEVSRAYTVAATAIGGFAAASAKTAIDYEAQFAQVARTTQATGVQLEALKSTMLGLSTDIPVSFGELAEIATLGAQMGIATADLDEFAETVAKVAATTNLSVDSASLGLGRLASMMRDLDASHFENAGSAISELGTASVATESEILSTAESIATTANMAGFTTDEVIGLSTALASLKVRPELARGGMQRIFAKINEAVGEGGEALQNYADVLGITTEQADRMWRNDPSTFFQLLAQSVGEVTDNVERQNMIREELGIRNSRDIEVLARLANGYDVYAQSMDLAADSYARGDYLDKESGVIFDTTAAALTKLSNAFKNMLANLGESTLTPITLMAKALIGLFNAVAALPPEITGLVTLFTLIGAGMLAYRAIIGRVGAAMYGFHEVQMALGVSGKANIATLLQLNAVMQAERAAATQAAAATSSLATAQGGVTVTGEAAAASTGAVTAATSASAVAAGGATGAFAALRASLKAHPIGWAVTALAAVGTIGVAVWDRFKSKSKEAAEATESFLATAGGAEGLFQALRKDAQELADGTQTEIFGEMTVGYEQARLAQVDNSEVIQNMLIPANEDAASAMHAAALGAKASTSAIEENTLAIGENARKVLATAFANEEMWEDVFLQNIMEHTGFDPAEMYRQMESEGFGQAGKEAGQAYVDGFLDEYTTLRNRWDAEVARLNQERENNPVGFGPEQQAELAQAEEWLAFYAHMADQFQIMSDGAGDMGVELTNMNNQMIISSAIMGELGDESEDTASDIGEVTDEVEALREALNAAVEDIFALTNAEAALTTAMEALGESIAENGPDFTTATAEGIANLDALQGAMGAAADYFAQQFAEGNITAEEAANGFEQYLLDLMYGLEELGVDTAQFETFMDDLRVIFDETLPVKVDTTVAEQDLINFQNFAIGVLDTTRAAFQNSQNSMLNWAIPGGSSSSSSSLIPWGGATRSNVPTFSSTGADMVRRANERKNAELRKEAADAAREAANADREAERAAREAANEQERAAREAERQAEAVKRLEQQISDVKDEIKEINDEGRIFEEIVKRLAEEMSRVFDETYGLMQATDSMEMSLIKMRQRVQDNVDKVKNLRDEYRKLRQEAADARVEERQARLFQSIARMYGDTERDISYGTAANEAAATVKEKEALAATSKKEADQLDKTRLALTGYSEQAITNRGDLVDLQQQMIKMIEEYAKTGATTQEVTEYAERLRRKFIDQATQMGYNKRDVENLSSVFDDLIETIKKVPRDVRIQVEADTRRAKDKLNELVRELEKQRTVPVTFSSNQRELTVSGNLTVQNVVARQIDAGMIAGVGGILGGGFARGGVVPGRRPADPYMDNLVATNGRSVFGIRSGEGIVNNRAMDFYGGKKFIDSVNNLQHPRTSAVVVHNTVTGPDVMRLAPEQIDELARKVSLVVGIDGRTIAGATNRYNVASTNRGQ